MSRKIIYSHKSEGTALPKYTSCKVYNDGLFIFEEGWLIGSKEKQTQELMLAREIIRSIERIIDQNYQIFSIKELEPSEYRILDGSYETLMFSDEQQKATFHLDDIFLYDENRHSKQETPNINLVLKVNNEIRKILITNGVDEDYL